MRLWDRLTGGAAEIEIETEKPFYLAGEVLRLRAQITSEGDLQAKSALVTLHGTEEVRYEVPVYEVVGAEPRDRDSSFSSNRDSSWGDRDRDNNSDWGRSSNSSSSGNSSFEEREGLRQVGTEEQRTTNATVNVEERIPGPIQVTGGQPFLLEAQVQIPRDAPPTYVGQQARHTYRLSVALDVAWSTNPSKTIDVIMGVGEESFR